MKKVIKIVAVMAALVALVTAFCFLLVGFDSLGIIRLPEILVMPEGMPTIIGGCIGIFLLLALRRRKALQEQKTVKPRWMIAAVAMLCFLVFGLPALGIVSVAEQLIYAALLFCAAMLLGSIRNKKRIYIAVFSVLVVSLISAAIFYRMGERVDWGVIAEYHQQAEQGDIDIQCVLGCFYYYGRGVVKDDTEAVKWLLLAAEQGQVDALYQLGLCHFLGAGVPRNEDEAIRSYWMAMQGGHAGAAFVLHKLELEYSEEYRQMKIRTNYGSTYERNGKPFDIALPTAGGNLDSSPNQLPRVSRNGILDAFDIMHRDEQLTHLSYPTVRPLDPNKTSYYHLKRDTIYVSPNCTQIAFDHELGRKLLFDFEKERMETAKQHHLAAERGDAEAMVQLGHSYLSGAGVLVDPNKAFSFFKKAAEKGNADGENMVGLCYLNGHGVQQDNWEAVQWFRKAANQGLPVAMYNMGHCYDNGAGVLADPNKAFSFYKKAAEKGNADGESMVGLCYLNGHGVPQDKQKAIQWLRKAVDQENAQAQFNLGECYFLGEGVAQDKEEAVRWLRQAAEQGHEEAANLLQEIEQR